MEDDFKDGTIVEFTKHNIMGNNIRSDTHGQFLILTRGKGDIRQKFLYRLPYKDDNEIRNPKYKLDKIPLKYLNILSGDQSTIIMEGGGKMHRSHKIHRIRKSKRGTRKSRKH